MNKTKSSNSIEVMNGEDFFKSTDSSLQRKSRSNSMYSLLFIRYIYFPSKFWNGFVIYRNKNCIYKYI